MDAKKKELLSDFRIPEGTRRIEVTFYGEDEIQIGETEGIETTDYAALAQPAQGEVVAYKDAPERIWLNLGECTAEEIAANHAGWNGLTEVTWCEDKIDQFDIPYVRADLAQPPADTIAVPVSEYEAMKRDAERYKARRNSAMRTHFKLCMSGCGTEGEFTDRYDSNSDRAKSTGEDV